MTLIRGFRLFSRSGAVFQLFCLLMSSSQGDLDQNGVSNLLRVPERSENPGNRKISPNSGEMGGKSNSLGNGTEISGTGTSVRL